MGWRRVTGHGRRLGAGAAEPLNVTVSEEPALRQRCEALAKALDAANRRRKAAEADKISLAQQLRQPQMRAVLAFCTTMFGPYTQLSRRGEET